MDRGEKKQGVRQGRPMRRGTASADILREADRIIRERIHEREGQGSTPSFWLGLLSGLFIGVLCMLIALLLR